MPWVHLYLLALASEQIPASQHVTMLETQTPTQWETGPLEAHGWRMPRHVGAGGLRGHPFLPQLDSFKALNKFLVLNGSICEKHQGVLWNLISVHQLGWWYCLCTSFLSFAFFFFHSAALESRVNSPPGHWVSLLQEAQLPAYLVFTEQTPLTLHHRVTLTFIKLPETLQAAAITHSHVLCLVGPSCSRCWLLTIPCPGLCADGHTVGSLLFPLAWLIAARLAVLKTRNHANWIGFVFGALALNDARFILDPNCMINASIILH